MAHFQASSQEDAFFVYLYALYRLFLHFYKSLHKNPMLYKLRVILDLKRGYFYES